MLKIIKTIRKILKLNLRLKDGKVVILQCGFDGIATILKNNSGEKELVIIKSSPSSKTYKKIVFQYNKYFSTLSDNENISIKFTKTLKQYVDVDSELKSTIIKTRQGGLIWSKDNHNKSIQLCNAVVISTKGI